MSFCIAAQHSGVGVKSLALNRSRVVRRDNHPMLSHADAPSSPSCSSGQAKTKRCSAVQRETLGMAGGKHQSNSRQVKHSSPTSIIARESGLGIACMPHFSWKDRDLSRVSPLS